MSILLENCFVFDPHSPYHQKRISIAVVAGKIGFGGISKVRKSYNLEGCWVTPGLFDMQANFCDPGLEHREDVSSGMRCAIAGGFSDVTLVPNTSPVVDSKSDVEYLTSKSGNLCNIHVLGALSEGCRGELMSEILDLHSAGAVALSDGNVAVHNSELLLKALQYVQKFDGVIFSRPSDRHLAHETHVHEGVVSTGLGLRGEPGISEIIAISSQLEILRYAGGRLHFSMMSSAQGISLIRSAKKEGLNVTCDVGINHLLFNDESTSGFDTNFKISPPFRTESDRKALLKAVNDGTIDAIVTGHQPVDVECKKLEFDLAESGIISLQTAFSVLMSLQKGLNLDVAIEKLTYGPRKILRQEAVTIDDGAPARMAIFDPKKSWTLNESTNLSKSNNSPFWGKAMTGKCIGMINGTEHWLETE